MVKRVEGPKPLRLVPWVVAVPVHAPIALVSDQHLKRRQRALLTTCRAWTVTLQILDWQWFVVVKDDVVVVVVVVVVSATCFLAIFAITPVFRAAAALALAFLAHLGTVVLIVKAWIVSQRSQHVVCFLACFLILIVDNEHFVPSATPVPKPVDVVCVFTACFKIAGSTLKVRLCECIRIAILTQDDEPLSVWLSVCKRPVTAVESRRTAIAEAFRQVCVFHVNTFLCTWHISI